jgi:hypothetical protein
VFRCMHAWTNCRLSIRPDNPLFPLFCWGQASARLILDKSPSIIPPFMDRKTPCLHHWTIRRLSLRPFWTKTEPNAPSAISSCQQCRILVQITVYRSTRFGQKLILPASPTYPQDPRPPFGQPVSKPSIPTASTVEHSGPTVFPFVQRRRSIRPSRLSSPNLHPNRFRQLSFYDLKLSF